jgi:hypothetical protein
MPIPQISQYVKIDVTVLAQAIAEACDTPQAVQGFFKNIRSGTHYPCNYPEKECLDNAVNICERHWNYEEEASKALNQMGEHQ